jgi:hypothetical protein
VIIFDEYWNYPAWKKHEYRAFEELKAAQSEMPSDWIRSESPAGWVSRGSVADRSPEKVMK